MKAADIAAVLLRLNPSDPRTLISRIKALAPVIQDQGAALLLDGHVDLVARAGADGAHLSGLEAFEEALPTLKPDRIAGVGGLATRHDSMTAGERGADYVLFGEPDENGQRPSMQAICDRLQWWDEVFELPSVGFAGTLEEAGAFTAAGADFILAGDFIWTASEGSRSRLARGHGSDPQSPRRDAGESRRRRKTRARNENHAPISSAHFPKFVLHRSTHLSRTSESRGH